MPSQRSILANIHELNLDPKKAHAKLSKKGSLVIENSVVEKQEKTVFSSLKVEEEETLELTQEQQQDLLKNSVEQENVTPTPLLVEKKNKKGFQKKVK